MATVQLLFDTETLGLPERAVVTTIACTAFTFEDGPSYEEMIENGFFAKLKVSEQIGVYKRITTPSTIQFWKEQSAEARERSINPSAADIGLREALENLAAWVKTTGYNWNKSHVWSRGNAFDFPKIESLFADANVNVPFNTWRIRDVRTYIDYLTGTDNGGYNLKDGEPAAFVKHHALHDAALDSAKMIEIYKTLAEA